MRYVINNDILCYIFTKPIKKVSHGVSKNAPAPIRELFIS